MFLQPKPLNQTVKGVAGACYAQLLKNQGQKPPGEFQVFESPFSPLQSQISFQTVYNYVYRLFKKAQVEPECLIAAVEYMDEFQRLSSCLLTAGTFQRMVFVAVLISSKVWDDVSCSSKSFAMCTTDFSLRELNVMERLFCKVLNFQLFLDTGDYKDYYYDMKKIWLSLQLDEEMQLVGWADQGVSDATPNWGAWGIPQMRDQMSNDVNQQKAVKEE